MVHLNSKTQRSFHRTLNPNVINDHACSNPNKIQQRRHEMQGKGSYLLMMRVLWWRGSHFNIDGSTMVRRRQRRWKLQYDESNRSLRARHKSFLELGMRAWVLLHLANWLLDSIQRQFSKIIFKLVQSTMVFIKTVIILNGFTTVLPKMPTCPLIYENGTSHF